ncbi:methyltransferase [Embleya sp. MST-111070]|uniref:methyltransferase n=1 Tax=Embleya sp. MST-111070 TaxID=3398231 RepID=UPI003F739EF4
MRPDDVESAVAVRALLYGHLVSRALCSVTGLGIPDLMTSGPRPVAELAELTGAHEPSLRQVMIALTAFDVFEELPDGRFGLARLGAALSTDAPGSARASALMADKVTGRAWHGIPHTVRTGIPAFESRFGAEFFDYLEKQPGLRELFDRSQSADLDLEIDAIERAHDFSETGILVDVGGGNGELMARLLSVHPQLRGVLVDRPAAVTEARTRLDRAGLAERTDVRAGDFFAAVPSGGDVYLLREILHDWDDDQCVTLLRACRRAMSSHSRLVLIELARDGGAADADAKMAALMSLYMLSVLPGRERTTDEFEALLSAAELRLDAVHHLTGQKVLIEASPARSTTVGPPVDRKLMIPKDVAEQPSCTR